MSWIYLSKNGTDEYINMFAKGSGVEPTTLETWNYESSTDPLVLRGILKHKIIKRCWEDGRRFLYMDSGYLGNRANPLNPYGWKIWHRIAPDNFQHGDIINRPADRWERLKIRPEQRRRNGKKILIAAPDEKPCQVYGVELNQWLDNVQSTLKAHTDRPIEIRQRDPNRQNRVQNDFISSLSDVWAVVTFNSNAAVESILAGVPVFVLATCSAALPVANSNLTKIEEPFFPDSDLVQAWCRHLAYGQFHNNELKDGTARRMLESEFP